AYALVWDGVATVEDIDTVMRDGLGLRWSFMGPFETVDLNTRGGISSHAETMGPAYERMGAERGQHDPWTRDLVAEVERQRRALVPLDQWKDRVAWRDRQLQLLAATRSRATALSADAASAADLTTESPDASCTETDPDSWNPSPPSASNTSLWPSLRWRWPPSSCPRSRSRCPRSSLRSSSPCSAPW